MSVSLSIKDVPEDLAERLRERARRNHRSLQGELLTILEKATEGLTIRELYERAQASGIQEKISVTELYERARASGYSSPSEAVQMIREDRDSR